MQKCSLRGISLIVAVMLISGAWLNRADSSGMLQAAQGRVAVSSAHRVYPANKWTRAASPAEKDWSQERLNEARKFAQKIGSAAIMIVMNGVVIDEWGDTTRPINVRSMRKSLLSALYGIATQEGDVRLSSTLADLKIDDKEKLTEQEKKARVSDLLTSRSGVYHPAAYETRSAKESRPVRGSHPPGSFFYYNNWDFNVLGTIFEQQTKTKIFEAFASRIVKPLEMEDFSVGNTDSYLEDSSIHPAYLFRMSARDLARFGLLYLRKGEWNGKRIINEDWIAESTRSHVEAATKDGNYGYMWWVYPPREGKQRAYAARGAGAQYLFIVPEVDIIVVHLTDPDNSRTPVKDSDGWQLLRMIYSASPWGNR